MEKEEVGRGCFELKPIGEKQEFRAVPVLPDSVAGVVNSLQEGQCPCFPVGPCDWWFSLRVGGLWLTVLVPGVVWPDDSLPFRPLCWVLVRFLCINFHTDSSRPVQWTSAVNCCPLLHTLSVSTGGSFGTCPAPPSSLVAATESTRLSCPGHGEAVASLARAFPRLLVVQVLSKEKAAAWWQGCFSCFGAP